MTNSILERVYRDFGEIEGIEGHIIWKMEQNEDQNNLIKFHLTGPSGLKTITFFNDMAYMEMAKLNVIEISNDADVLFGAEVCEAHIKIAPLLVADDDMNSNPYPMLKNYMLNYIITITTSKGTFSIKYRGIGAGVSGNVYFRFSNATDKEISEYEKLHIEKSTHKASNDNAPVRRL